MTSFNRIGQSLSLLGRRYVVVAGLMVTINTKSLQVSNMHGRPFPYTVVVYCVDPTLRAVRFQWRIWGCQRMYTVIPSRTVTDGSTPNCANLTFPASTLPIQGLVTDGPLSQFGWVPSVRRRYYSHSNSKDDTQNSAQISQSNL